MYSRIKYFVAIKVPCNVHSVETKHQKDKPVRCDLSTDEVFDYFRQMSDIVVFDNSVCAKRFADKEYFATATRHSSGLFEQNSPQKSNDAELLKIYGDGAVSMKVRPVTILYQFEGEYALKEMCEKVCHNNENYYGYKVTAKNKDKLTMDVANVQELSLHFTEDVAEREGCATKVELLDHRHFAVKRGGCTIL